MSDGGVDSQSVRIPGALVDEVPHSGPVPEDVASPPPVESVDPATAAPAAAAEAEPEPKKRGSRSVGMAAAGQPVTVPGPPQPRPSWPGVMNEDEVYVPEEFDVTDLAVVNREMNRARARIFRVSQSLKIAQRTLAEAQSDYDRAFRRQLVTLTGGTSESRRAMAEINCEHLENRIIVGKQVVEEWRKRATDARDDLKAIENIAHNVRAQMDVR